MKMTFLAVLFVSLALTGCQNRSSATKGFDSIRASILKGDFESSIPKLEEFIAQNPNSRDASRAGLFLFKCHAATGNFEKAKQWCDWTIKSHATSLEARKCRYKLAMVSLWEHDIESAKHQFGTIATEPDGPLAAEAKQMLNFLTKTQIAEKNAGRE